jgi:uncharacterized protein (TIGR00369 family)
MDRPATPYDPIGAETASGFQTLTGYRLIAWSPGRATIEMAIAPHHLNRGGIVHGGMLATLLDVAAGHAATFCDVPGRMRLASTVALATTFIAPARAGVLRAEGALRGGGRKTVSVTAEITDADGALIAIAQGSYKYLPGSETTEGAPRAAR